MLYSRSLLPIYLMYSSVCMLMPSSWFIPPHHGKILVTISLFLISGSLFLFCKWVHMCQFLTLDTTHERYHCLHSLLGILWCPVLYFFKPFWIYLVYAMMVCSNFIDLHGAVQISQHHLLKKLSFPHCIRLYFKPLKWCKYNNNYPRFFSSV